MQREKAWVLGKKEGKHMKIRCGWRIWAIVMPLALALLAGCGSVTSSNTRYTTFVLRTGKADQGGRHPRATDREFAA
jgi:hypothetical protein